MPDRLHLFDVQYFVLIENDQVDGFFGAFGQIHHKGARLCPKIDLAKQTIAQFDKLKSQMVFFGLCVLAGMVFVTVTEAEAFAMFSA